jgi:hypothetical protein
MSRVYAAVLLSVLCAASPAVADCDHFKWSVARELQWFGSGPSPIASGASVPLDERAYRIALRPTGEVQFVQPPERSAAADAFAGVVKIEGIDAAGLYQVTLSDEAWIDVVQSGARLESAGFSGQKDCPGVRKSVRFQLEKGAAVIQISSSRRDTLTLAIAKAR